MKYHVEKGILPVMPGDYVWTIERDPAHLVRAVRVKSVELRENNEMRIVVGISYRGRQSEDEFFLTAEEAEQEAAKCRQKPPFRHIHQAVSWMPAETWIPGGKGWIAVRIRREDGSEERRKAWYDDGDRYPDERGFYESDRRSAARLENVTAWIDDEYIDTEEWYDGKPIDFSYSCIEELDLSIRIWNALKESGIRLIRDIFKKDGESVRNIPNLGKRGLEELIQKLEKAGFDAGWLKKTED